MTTSPENELDLEKLFLPAWAQEPSSAKLYAHYEGGDLAPERRGDRRGRRPGPREAGRGERPRGDRRGPPRREGDRRFPGPPRSGPRREEPRERREPPPPLPELNTSFVPDEKGVESLARQIKATGRAYPLFDIARLILQKPERYSVMLSVRKKPEGQAIQPLFVCALDDTAWLSEDEAVSHVLHKHFATFYQTERTPAEPPKGKYTFVAQCGMSGTILGPPNYHDYQNQLRKLHAERFSRMPFEAFKARVKIVRDEEVVKKWIDDQSWKTEYICLNLPEPLRLGNLQAVEKHFREIHKDNIIKSVESHTLSGTLARGIRSTELAHLVRQHWEDQRRFPLQLATGLSQRFATHGLQFFKVNKSITHVSVARPHYLDLETTPVSDGVKRIVQFVDAHPRCSRRQLIDALASAPPIVAAPPAAIPSADSSAQAPASAEPPPAPAEAAEPTAEQTAVIADLHWLIHQGHVIEFANGLLETAKKPAPRPPKPVVEKPVESPTPEHAAAVPSADAAASGAETSAEVEAPSSAPGETPAEPAADAASETVSSENQPPPEAVEAPPPAPETAPVAETPPSPN
jgi:hypothetical protein